MLSIPPPPPGFTEAVTSDPPRRQRRDPWEILSAEGFTLNNGYRTQGDQERIRRQGYSPAPNSAHLSGDAMDLGHPRLSARQQQARARELLSAEGWDSRLLYHDGHLHVTVPGWGAAPGTPGTANFGLPPPPPGFDQLVQRGNMSAANFNPNLPATPPQGALGPSMADAAMVGALAVQNVLGGPEPEDAAAAQNLAAWNGTAPPSPSPASAPRAALPAPVAEDTLGAPPPPSSRYLPNSPVDRSSPVPSGRPGQPFVRPTFVRTEQDDPRLAGINERSRDLYVSGASADRIAAAWREAGVDPAIIRATMPRLRAAVTAGRRWTPQRRAEIVWDMDNAFRTEGVPEPVTQTDPDPAPVTDPRDDPARGDLNRQMGLPGIPGAATYGSFVGPGGVEYVASPENIARYPEYANSDRGEREESERTGRVAASMRGAEFRAPPERTFLQRSADAASDALREYSPAAAFGRFLERNIPNASDYRANDTRTPEQVQADRANRSTAAARERRARIALREQGDPANSALDHVADFSGAMVGGAAGDPTTLLMPGRTLVQRMLGTAAIGGGVDATLQTVEIGEGVRDEYSPTQTIVSTAAGPALIGGGRMVGNVARAAGVPVPSGAARDRARAEERAAARAGAGQADDIPPPPVGFTEPVPSPSAPVGSAPRPTTEARPPARRERVEAMEREDIDPAPSISSEIIPADIAPLPAGARPDVPLGDHSPIARPSPQELADIARGVDPEDVLPRPSNRVLSLDEHIAASEGRWQRVEAPDERAELTMRTLRSHGGQDVRFRGPVDAETFLRMNGGLIDQGGELRHMGITNNRPRPEVSGEDRLGPLLNKQGMTLDDAGELLFEAGYFPNHASRPSIDEVLDLLGASRRGERTFLPNDLDEIGRFYDAQAQRYAVERAEQEGAPLYDDISRPAGEDTDLPPITAYEDLPTITDRVSNLNLRNIESAEDIGRLLQHVEESFGGFDAARRGRMDFGEIQALADELGMTADDLLRRRPGQALNAEQALAARSILAKSSDEVIELAGRARGGSDADRTAFAEALLRHAAIQEQVTGAVAEAGRALSSMRQAASSRSVARRIHEITADSMGGTQRLEDIADKILDLQRLGAGPGETTRFAVDAIKPRKRDMLSELWYNSLLSGPQTHVVNTLSNTLTGLANFPEQAIAVALGQGRRAIRAARGLEDDFDRVTMTEMGARTIGYLQGTREGLSSSWNTLRTGEVSDFVAKVESRVQEAIPGRVGKVIRTPSRLLAAEDEFFKAIARRMELAALAARMARKEGLRGEAYRERVADLNRNPTDEMLERSLDFARYMTFQRPLTGLVAEVSRWTQRAVWPKLFIPFIRTPTNILKYAVERSPAAPILREVRRGIAAGGEQRAIAMARIMFGTGIGMTVMSLVDQGVITGGGPAWSGAEDMMRADGWQPYSIKIGDTYYSYARLDPLALTLGIAADLKDYTEHMTPRQSEQAGALLVTSIMRNLENKTWLSGMSDLLSVVQDPERNLNRVAGRIAGSIVVPSIINQTTRYMDPVQRETRTPSGGRTGWGPMVDSMLGAIQNRIPGMSSSLEARRDVLGREMRSEGGLGPDAVSPIWTRAARNDPIIRELLDNMIALGRPSRFITVNGERRELTPQEYGRLQELSGQYMQTDLAELITGPDWRDATLQERRRWVSRIKREARADARADLGIGGNEDDEEAAAPPPPSGFVPAL